MSRAQRRAAWLDQHRSGAGPGIPAPAAPSPAIVRLHIGELALRGFPRLSRHDVADAVSAELTGLIAVEGLPAHLRAPSRTRWLRGMPVTLARGAPPAVVGSQIARSIFGGRGR
jgi:hypothetical protein